MSGNAERPVNRYSVDHEELFQLYVEKLQEVEKYRALLLERERAVMADAENMAAPIIETTISAIVACRDLFDDYYRQRRGNMWQRIRKWFRNVRK